MKWTKTRPEAREKDNRGKLFSSGCVVLRKTFARDMVSIWQIAFWRIAQIVILCAVVRVAEPAHYCVCVCVLFNPSHRHPPQGGDKLCGQGGWKFNFRPKV